MFEYRLRMLIAWPGPFILRPLNTMRFASAWVNSTPVPTLVGSAICATLRSANGGRLLRLRPGHKAFFYCGFADGFPAVGSAATLGLPIVERVSTLNFL